MFLGKNMLAIMSAINVMIRCFALLHLATETIHAFTSEQLRVLDSASCYFGIRAP
jgi:cell division protein ZapA (FtsZ GTPase activity inhibitor)